MNKKVWLAIAGIAVVIGLLLFSSYTSVYDQNVKLKNSFKAQNKEINIVYDEMYKVIFGQAQVTDRSVSAFKEMYTPLIQGRYSNDKGMMMKWIQEQNPAFDFSSFNTLMQTIESKRHDFFLAQEKILAIKEQHDNLREKFWSHIWLGDEKELEYKEITSTITEEVVKSRKDDNVDIFGGGKMEKDTTK